jgi:spermidine synthase
MLLLSVPFMGFYVVLGRSLSPGKRWLLRLSLAGLLAWTICYPEDYEIKMEQQRTAVVRRDYAALVISSGAGRNKGLLVNGIGMTALAPVTKIMVHLPLALCEHRPQSALVICFGMGTSFRAALSWDIRVTAVELVPSVVKAFGFYWADADRCLENPLGRIVIDDGRRYLRRTTEKFDVIVVDPPPPLVAAGSSLLFSTEFCEVAKQHLTAGGILQIWVPEGEAAATQAVARSVAVSFPFVRCFLASDGGPGFHLLASMEPIVIPPPEKLAARLPESARRDLMEWSPVSDPGNYLGIILSREIPVEQAESSSEWGRVTDDHPYNEYFLLRRALAR